MTTRAQVTSKLYNDKIGHFVTGLKKKKSEKITVIRQVCFMSCDLNVKLNTCETLHGLQRLWTHFACICFLQV